MAYTKSIVDNTYYEFQTQLADPLTVAVKLNAELGMDFVPSGVDFADPASYLFRRLYENRQHSTGDQWQWQGNLDLDTGSSLLPKFKFGLRYADRKANSTYGDHYAGLSSLRDPITRVPGVSDGGIIEAGFHGDDVQQCRSWFAPNANILNDRINDVRDHIRQALVRANADGAARQAWATAAIPICSHRMSERVPEAAREFQALDHSMLSKGQRQSAELGLSLALKREGDVIGLSQRRSAPSHLIGVRSMQCRLGLYSPIRSSMPTNAGSNFSAFSWPPEKRSRSPSPTTF